MIKLDVYDCLVFFLDIREQLRQIEKSVITKEPRFVFRVLRSLPNTRRRLNPTVLKRIISQCYGFSPKERDNLFSLVGGDDTLDITSPVQRTRLSKQGNASLLPEVCEITVKYQYWSNNKSIQQFLD